MDDVYPQYFLEGDRKEQLENFALGKNAKFVWVSFLHNSHLWNDDNFWRRFCKKCDEKFQLKTCELRKVMRYTREQYQFFLQNKRLNAFQGFFYYFFEYFYCFYFIF